MNIKFVMGDHDSATVELKLSTLRTLLNQSKAESWRHTNEEISNMIEALDQFDADEARREGFIDVLNQDDDKLTVGGYIYTCRKCGPKATRNIMYPPSAHRRVTGTHVSCNWCAQPMYYKGPTSQVALEKS